MIKKHKPIYRKYNKKKNKHITNILFITSVVIITIMLIFTNINKESPRVSTVGVCQSYIIKSIIKRGLVWIRYYTDDYYLSISVERLTNTTFFNRQLKSYLPCISRSSCVDNRQVHIVPRNINYMATVSLFS